MHRAHKGIIFGTGSGNLSPGDIVNRGAETVGSASVGHTNPNLFRGMVFGMTTRYACTDISTPIWHLCEWTPHHTMTLLLIHMFCCDATGDLFGIEEARMIGWWDDDAPVSSAHEDVQVTSYVRQGNATLLAVASWATKSVTASLNVSWAALGLNSNTAKVEAPAMAGVQPHASFKASAEGLTLQVEAAGGWLLMLSGA